MPYRIPVLIVFFLLAGAASGQGERLTLDWIFSDEGKHATTLPDYAWAGAETVALYDGALPESGRTIELVNVASERRRRIDADKVLAAMTELLEPEEPIEEIGMPSGFDSAGRRALYLMDGDVLLLDLRRSELTRITDTDAEESSPRFSPDGRYVAFVRNNDLYAWDIEAGEESRLTHDGSDTLMNGTVSWVYWEELLNRADRGFAWSPDSKSIAYLQTDDSGVGIMNYVDFEPDLPRVIQQRHAKPGQANPRVRAGVVDLDSGETRWLDIGSYPYEYLVRMQWLPDSRRVALQVLNRAQTVLDLFFADATGETARHVLRETDDGWVNVHDDLHFIDGGARFLWRSERSGFSHLYLYDADGELLRPVTSGEWALRQSGGPPDMTRAVSFVDESAGTVYFTALEKSTTERHLYRVGIDGSRPERISVADGVHDILFSPHGRHYLDAESSLVAPPSLTARTADGGTAMILARPGRDIPDRFGFTDWELFSIRAGDGFEMPAMLLKPRFFDPARKYPVVIYVYGGPSAPTVVNAWQGSTRSWYHRVLAESGAVVMYVDNRSAAGKSKIDANSILRQLYGPVEMNDLLDAVAWLKAQPWVDTERVGIWGWSGGGTMTLQALTSSEEFVAGVAVAPVTDWHYYDTIYTERYMKRPQDNETGYESTSHVKRAANLHGRLLLVHGTYDDNVHPQNSWAFGNALIDAGITFDMMIYPMRKHGISDDAAQQHVFTTMYEFWQENLGLGD